MKKKLGTVGIIVIVVALLAMWVISIYNGLVRKDEAVASAWSQVENVYQRRADLIPNLVSTVKGAADFERNTLQEVVEARASATQVKLSADELTEANVAKFQAAQDALSASLGRLLVSVERYPDLKATQNFRDLQAQLEGTENRIAVERQKFNEKVKEYNTTLRRFPTNIFASMFHFEKKGYFTAKEGADEAPEVDFDFGK
ncbi:MAG: LemA family protein [Bacteroidales bacterium]|nr:LemA family protein [Bacteroidales bacterium]MDE7337793.1 LemA family protein [Bacteroidales bacterium]